MQAGVSQPQNTEWAFLAHQAVASGSEMISDSSCAKMEAMPSAAVAPLGPTAWYSQVAGQRLTLPTKPKLRARESNDLENGLLNNCEKLGVRHMGQPAASSQNTYRGQ